LPLKVNPIHKIIFNKCLSLINQFHMHLRVPKILPSFLEKLYVLLISNLLLVIVN
jgi:hypothetical protein